MPCVSNKKETVMRLSALLALLTACIAAGQIAQPGAPEIVVPAGTKVALRLTAPLDSLTARAGDTVHAKVAFPVAVGDTVAIPQETYVQGAIDKTTRRGRHAGFLIHFTHLIFTNGYTIALPGAAADTRVATITLPIGPGTGPPSGMAQGIVMQPPPPVPPQVNMPGPHTGAIVGMTVGSAVAGVIAVIALAHRGGGITLDTGSTIDMTLASAISLDGAKVAAALAAPVTN